MSSSPPQENSPDSPPDGRRGFLARFFSIVIGGVVGLFPLATGLVVFFDPLRKTSDAIGSIRITTLDSVPADGVARQFPVIADRTDAWNFYPNELIGTVFLRREKGSTKVEALNAKCPHAGCFVEYKIPEKQFQCPCHNSSFEPSGVRINSTSPRDLDTLEVDQEMLKDGEVWVFFKNFISTRSDKKAIS